MIHVSRYDTYHNIFHRGVEIVKFSTCPGTSKKPKYTCPQKILLVQRNKLAYTLQCFNNLFFKKQYATRYISTLVNSMDPDQLASLVNSVDPDQLASVFNARCELVIINQNKKYRIVLI